MLKLELRYIETKRKESRHEEVGRKRNRRWCGGGSKACDLKTHEYNTRGRKVQTRKGTGVNVGGYEWEGHPQLSIYKNHTKT